MKSILSAKARRMLPFAPWVMTLGVSLLGIPASEAAPRGEGGAGMSTTGSVLDVGSSASLTGYPGLSRSAGLGDARAQDDARWWAEASKSASAVGGGRWSESHSREFQRVLDAGRSQDWEVGGVVAAVVQRAVATAFAAGVVNPFQVDMGDVPLQPNRSEQWVTLSVRNTTSSPIAVDGLNFYLQVADTGPASEGGFGLINGPNIQAVDLSSATIFAGNTTGTQGSLQVRPAQAGWWTTTTSAGSVVIPVGTSVPLARVEFDTSGFSNAGDRWTLSLTVQSPGSSRSFPTAFDQIVGGSVNSLGVTAIAGSLLIAVPESAEYAVVWGLVLVGAAATRRWRCGGLRG